MKRRDFLKKFAVASGIGLLAAPKAGFALPTSEKKELKAASLPKLPWKYEEIDPEYVRKLGHLGFYMFECSGAVFWAIMTALREKVGYPYTLIPMPTKDEVIEALEMGEHPFVIPMEYGYAGIMGWGTLCGTLNASASVINFVKNPRKRVTKEIITKLFLYYERNPFPTDTANKYAANHEYFVPYYKTDKPLPQSISLSPLCHVSVSKWCIRSGYGSKTKQRSERCARLAGDIAAMAVTLLNASLHGKLHEVLPITFRQESVNCMRCHKVGKNYEKGEIIKGEMSCTTCHKDLRPHIAENKLRTAFGVDVGKWAGAAAIGTVAGVGSHLILTNLAGKEDKKDEEK